MSLETKKINNNKKLEKIWLESQAGDWCWRHGRCVFVASIGAGRWHLGDAQVAEDARCGDLHNCGPVYLAGWDVISGLATQQPIKTSKFAHRGGKWRGRCRWEEVRGLKCYFSNRYLTILLFYNPSLPHGRGPDGSCSLPSPPLPLQPPTDPPVHPSPMSPIVAGGTDWNDSE